MKREKELTINTLIIMIGKISTQFITFLLLPLYTSLLSKSDYGKADFVMTIIQLIIPICSLMLEQSTFRYLLDKNDDTVRKKIISTSIIMQFIMYIVGIIIFAFIYLIYKNTYVILATIIIFLTCLNNLFLQISRGFKNTKMYSFSSFICSISIVIFNIIFIAVMKTGAIGMLISMCLGNLICLSLLFVKLKIYQFFSFKMFDTDTAKKLLKYSLPLIPNNLSIWIMNSSDKVIVTLFLGASFNGILAVSHKFPAIFMTFFNIFLLSWHELVSVHFYDKDRNEFLSKMINKILLMFIDFSILILLSIPFLFSLLINKEYAMAYFNIPVYMIGSIFNVVIGLYGAVYVASKNTKPIFKTTIYAALINIVLHVVLVGKIGLYAASISTLLGYFIAMIYRFYDTKSIVNIKLNFPKIIIKILWLLIATIGYYANNKILLLFLIIFYLIYIIKCNSKYIMNIKKIIKEKIGR